MSQGEFTQEEVERGWQVIGKFSQELKARADSQGAWPVAPGSALAADDKATRPFNTSHLLQSLLVTSSDHLHALCSLLFDAKALHPFATSTIVRSSIELAASAAWILQPKVPRERVIRALQLRSADERDRANAMKTWNLPDPVGDFQRKWAHEKIHSLGLTKLPRVTNTAILSEVSTHLTPHSRLTPFSVWQLASGFAHGRQWAPLLFLEREDLGAADVDVVGVRFTLSPDRLMPLAYVAMKTLEHAVDLYTLRGSRPVPPAAKTRRAAN